MFRLLFVFLVFFASPAYSQNGWWSQENFPLLDRTPQPGNVTCPAGFQTSQCLQFSGVPRFREIDPIGTTYYCESGHSDAGNSCYMGGCGATRGHVVCLPNMSGRHIKEATAPANTVAQVTCDAGTKVVSCHSWVGTGNLGCGVNVSSDGRTCSTNPCGEKTVRAICAAKEVQYIFNARSAQDLVCPADHTVSACHSLHIPSGKAHYFNNLNAQTLTEVNNATTGTNPTACSFASDMQHYLFCVQN